MEILDTKLTIKRFYHDFLEKSRHRKCVSKFKFEKNWTLKVSSYEDQLYDRKERISGIYSKL